MNRRSVLAITAALATAVAVLTAQAAPASAIAPQSGTWTSAREVAGRLNVDGYAAVVSVSCASAGNCAAGGQYQDGAAQQVPFVVSEAGGSWQLAQQVPGIGALDLGPSASAVTAVSCPSAGECTAVGTYSDASSEQQVFVVSQAAGAWGQAQEIPGTADLNLGGHAAVLSLSCRAATSCSGGGTYADGSGAQQALVVTETAGTWTAQEVAGSLNVSGRAAITSVSCSSAGNCGAGGYYSGKAGERHGDLRLLPVGGPLQRRRLLHRRVRERAGVRDLAGRRRVGQG